MKTIYIILALLLVNLPISAVQYSMPITWDGAQDNNLCWAACCQMILGFYGQTVEQSDIVQLGTGGVDTTNVLFQQSLEPWDSNSCAQIIYTLGKGNIQTANFSSPLSWPNLVSAILDTQPCIAQVLNSNQLVHFVVVRGITLADSLISWLDPSNPSDNKVPEHNTL